VQKKQKIGTGNKKQIAVIRTAKKYINGSGVKSPSGDKRADFFVRLYKKRSEYFVYSRGFL
jgi:hypothetical protein